MLRMEKHVGWFMLTVITLLLGSCGGGSQHATTEIYVMVATNIKIPYWQSAAAGLKNAATQLGVKYDFTGPATYDPEGQRDEFRRVLARKPQPAGIMVSPADAELMKPEIDSAIAQGIPVVTIDSDAPASKRLLYIGTDNYQAGLMGGRVAADQLKGKGNVIVFTMPEQLNLNDRLRGYQDVFQQHPEIKITEVVDVKGDPAVAFDKTSQVIDKARDSVDAFVCLEALACKEVAEVLDRKHVSGKLIVAMDTDELTLEWIQKGAIAATVAQKPYTMAFTALKILDDLHHHMPASLDENWAQNPFSPIPVFVDTGATLVDKSNVAAFLRARESATGT